MVETTTTPTIEPDATAKFHSKTGLYKLTGANAPDSSTWTDAQKTYYQQKGTLTGYSATPTPTPTPDPTTDPGTIPEGGVPLTQVVPGNTAGATQMSVVDYSGQLAHDPESGMSAGMLLSDDVPTFSEEQTAAGTVEDQPAMSAEEFSNEAATVQDTATAAAVDPREAVDYEASTTQGAVEQNDMTAAQGSVSQQSQMVAPQIDTEATGRGENEVGKALNAAAVLDLNDVDARATLKGQIDILQDEFKDEDGNPIVPSWATGIARQVSRIAAFKGISGTAATEAMSNALLEASISVAEQDAKFFQTVTLTNLNNRQQSTINKANVLAQMDLANLDARTTAAVENAKNFMAMDMANLDNDQQARLVNTQQRFQSILEDSKAINAARLFGADSANEMAKFYDTINATLSQFNAAQTNAMSQFNVGETNAMAQFNSTLADSRDKFYREMAYNIDLSNAEWRRTIATTETQMTFEAAAFDAKNMVNISQEALNQIWDRSDALLDYIWKSSENQMDRNSALAIAKLQSKTQKQIAASQADAADSAGFGQVLGTVSGAILGPLVGSFF